MFMLNYVILQGLEIEKGRVALVYIFSTNFISVNKTTWELNSVVGKPTYTRTVTDVYSRIPSDDTFYYDILKKAL